MWSELKVYSLVGDEGNIIFSCSQRILLMHNGKTLWKWLKTMKSREIWNRWQLSLKASEGYVIENSGDFSFSRKGMLNSKVEAEKLLFKCLFLRYFHLTWLYPYSLHSPSSHTFQYLLAYVHVGGLFTSSGLLSPES